MKTANKNFTSIKNDYEMTFTNETTVEPVNMPFLTIISTYYQMIYISVYLS